MRPLRTASAAAICGLCALAQPAAAQYGGPGALGALGGGGLGALGGIGGGITAGLRPNIGADPRVGDIRPQLESYFARNLPAPSIATPAWLIQPSIGVDIGATDNVQRTRSPRRADIFTTLNPSIAVSRDGPRFKLNAAYSPSYTQYAQTSNQTRFSQEGNLRASTILVPDTLFVDARGSVTNTPLVGNGFNNQSGTANYNRQNEVTSYTYSISPYAERRFGGIGSGRVSYSLSRTLQETQDNQNGFTSNAGNSGTTPLFGTPGYGATGNLTTQRERASFVTGENLGRFNNSSYAEAVQYSGSGSYRGAHRNEAQNELGFALTRKVTLLGGVGYQDIAYSGTPPYRINEPTWNTGVRYAPNPDSTLTVLYGRRDGSTSVSFDGQFSPTARTRVFGRYSTGITSDVEEAQTVLESTSVGATGQLTDSQSGAPIGAGGGINGAQNGIYKSRRLSVSGLLLRDRDSFSVAVSTEDRTTLTNTSSILNNGVIPAGTNSTSINVSGTWQHDIAADMSGSLSAQYGVTNNTSQLVNGTSGQQRTASLSAVLTKRFTETLSGSLRYTFTDQTGGNGGQSNTFFNPNTGRTFNTGAYTDNIVLVGLRKSF